jgi:ribokinase
MSSRVVVVGSLNLDIVVVMDRLPAAGETVMGNSLARHAGGKGLNQAVAAARLGAPVTMLGAVGDDVSGEWLVNVLHEAQIDASYIRTIPGTSGTALIEVENGGENHIVVVPGANAELDAAQIAEHITSIPDVGYLLIQSEIKVDVIEAAIRAAHARGTTIIFNPSPIKEIDPAVLKMVDIIIPNEHEAAQLTNMETDSSVDATEAALTFNERGIGTAIITRGAKGCVWASGANTGSVPVFKVQPIDTVGAGDAFCGGLAAALSMDLPLAEALRWASATGALATTKAGAVPSLPYREAVEELLELNS